MEQGSRGRTSCGASPNQGETESGICLGAPYRRIGGNPDSPLYTYEEPSLPDSGAVPRSTWTGSATSMRFADSTTRGIPSRILRGSAATRTFISSAKHSKSVMAWRRLNIGEAKDYSKGLGERPNFHKNKTSEKPRGLIAGFFVFGAADSYGLHL